MASLILIIAMFALLWILLIRPQRQRQQEQQRMIEAVEPGDEILTVGGIYGIVEEFDEEDDLVVEIAEGIRVRVARRAVASVVKPEEEAYEAEETLEGEIEPVVEETVNEDEDAVRTRSAKRAAGSRRR